MLPLKLDTNLCLLRKHDFRVLDLLADCYGLLGLSEHAAEHLSNAISLPKVPSSLCKKLGMLYKSLGNSRKYVQSFSEYFSRQLESNPSNTLEISDDSEFEAASAIIKNPSEFNQKYLKILASAVFKYPAKKVNTILHDNSRYY